MFLVSVNCFNVTDSWDPILGGDYENLSVTLVTDPVPVCAYCYKSAYYSLGIY